MLNDLECQAIPELANDLRRLIREINRLEEEEVMAHYNLLAETVNKFEVALCHIAVKYKDCVADFRWRPEPTPPEEYTRYKSLSPKDKSIFRDQNTDFFRKGKVFNYLDAKDVVSCLNVRNLETLKRWFGLKGISAEARLSVEKYINTYSGRMS